MKRAFLSVLVFFFLFLGVKADILESYYFDGKLGDKITVSFFYQLNADSIAAGYIYYPNAKSPAPILLVGTVNEEGIIYLNEYQPDGTISGCLYIELDYEDAESPRIKEGKWTNPKTGKAFPLKEMSVTDYPLKYGIDFPGKYDCLLIPESPQNIGREYSFQQWDDRYQAMMGGHVAFRGAGKGKVHFEISNVVHNIAEGESEPTRPAELDDFSTFTYHNVNECGYGFKCYIYKQFLVIRSITGASSFNCFGMGASFDGVYVKVKQ